MLSQSLGIAIVGSMLAASSDRAPQAVGVWRLPRLLPVIGNLAELSRVQAELAGHLRVRVGKVIPLPGINPGLNLRRKSARTVCHAAHPDQRQRASIRPAIAMSSGLSNAITRLGYRHRVALRGLPARRCRFGGLGPRR
jgi:hypothetical protein